MNSVMRYVVHEHKADRAGLHYDIRFEAKYPGRGLGLFSFATRKFPDLYENKVKRLLVFETAWHEPFWIDFQGRIAEGYGKGTIKIWDTGTYESLYPKSIYSQYKDGHFKLRFYSKRNKGVYDISLVRLSKINFNATGVNPEKTWLLTLKRVESK